MLIRYKDYNINLNNVFYIEKPFNKFLKIYEIEFYNINNTQAEQKVIKSWFFDSEEERNKIYDMLLNKCFFDLEII